MTTSAKAKAKAQQYRQSENGRQARRAYLANPEVRAKMKARRMARKALGIMPMHRARG